MEIKKAKNYVNGQWVSPTNNGWMDVNNPSTGKIIGKVPFSSLTEANSAVEVALKAYKKWKDVPVGRRVQPLFKLAQLLRENEEKISRVLTEEMGKSLPDSRAEMKRAIENCEAACGMPILQQGEKLVGASLNIDGEVLRMPIGVFGVIAPFNFPAMVPFWFLPYALATGNTLVLKPSERVPFTMQFITELIEKSGFPPGVFNLLNGNKETADALVSHPSVKGVSIVGSSSVCRQVAEKCIRLGKRFQAMGSAKNHLVIMPDAKIDEVIRNMITSCYGCAGQRCMASSAIIAVGEKMYKTVCEKFVQASKKVLVANPLDPAFQKEEMLMGPVISPKAKQFISDMIETGVKEGATLALDGRNYVVEGNENGYFIGPTVFIDVKPGMSIHTTEIFGPVVVILKADSIDTAIEIINNHKYGNGASIYTQNGYYSRRFKLEAEAGMIGINIGIPAPVAALPFGGMKESLFSDIKAQGKSIIDFYTEEKIITERYWPENKI